MLDSLDRVLDGWDCLPLRSPTLPPATHTNALLVGRGAFAVIDPGAIDKKEQRRLLEAVADRIASGERYKGVLLTHHHGDHIAGLAPLMEVASERSWSTELRAHPETLARIDVPALARPTPIDDGDQLELGDCTLEAIYTPGHAPGHLAFAERGEGAVYAGDMVAGVGTIIVAPPEGDMTLYMRALSTLLALDASTLVPSHGEPFFDGAVSELLQHYVAHRTKREQLVLSALSRSPMSALELVPAAYPELAIALWPLAAQSLEAHLIKLQSEGVAHHGASGWSRSD